MSIAAAEEVPRWRLYNNKQGAERIGDGKVVRASTLGRLARTGKVPHTRVGRKVLWTEEQLAGVVAHLATDRATPKPPPTKKPTEPSPRPRGAIEPLVSRPGRRYSTPATP